MSPAHAEFYNINGARRIGAAMETQYNISCNYKPGDKVRYKWKNDKIRSGTVTHIDFSVNIKNSVIGCNRSMPLEEVVGYNTDK